jgi:NAD(P)-dependent dehydrogenase (short-subunit alcohol dehydrogenase family)
MRAAFVQGPGEMSARLAGRVAVVTGASRGIGRAIATRLALEGARVHGCSLRGPAAGPGFLADLDVDTRRRCTLERCDVRSADAVARFAKKVLDGETPDILINNAGTVSRGPLETISDETWNDVVGSSLTGTFLITRAFLGAMKARGRGRIINIASIAGRQGTALLVPYCAAKHGVVGLTRALAEELRGTDIAVNAICPGSVDTDMLAIGMPGGTANMTPAQIADVALFLAMDAPAALHGACVDVFG